MSNPTPPPSRPLTARGGIRAQTKSRKVGKNWWTKRWMSVLEGVYMGAELPRGRAYAQAGQVLTIDIAHGRVTSFVQGSEKKPQEVSIEFVPAAKTLWTKLAKALTGQAYYTAKLLSGDMPESIEELFAESGLSLFPGDLDDMNIKVNGKKSTEPNRAVIAVYYLLAEEFDRDPFLFMKLRGLDRDKLIDSIGRKGKKRTSKKKPDWLLGDFSNSPLHLEEAVDANVLAFWQGVPISEELLGEVRIPPVPGALSKHLGHFPMWRGEERFLDALELVYKKASQNGMDVFVGDW
jgi:uncharacterized Zn finger protein